MFQNLYDWCIQHPRLWSWLLALVASAFLMACPAATTVAQTTLAPDETAFYVAVAGSDNNPGTEAAPLRTIQAAVDAASAGDTIYVRTGTYTEQVVLRRSGTRDQPIRLLAYPGERPVIDGEYTLPVKPDSYAWPICNDAMTPVRCVHYEALVSISASYVEVSGFTVVHSLGRGIRAVNLTGLRLYDNQIHDHRGSGIYLQNVTNALIDQNQIWHSGDVAPYERSPLVLDWPVAVVAWDSSDITYRGNHIFNNWGEGLSTGKNSVNVVVEDNVFYDNYALQLYVHRTQNATVQRNFIYCTNQQPFLRDGNPSAGISIADEDQFDGEQLNQNHRIRNNVIAGCGYNLVLVGSAHDYPLRNIEITHNTLVHAVSNVGHAQAAALVIHSERDYEDVLFADNIVYQPDGVLALVPRQDGLTFAHNLWSRKPPIVAASAEDLIGDPALLDPDALLDPEAVEPADQVQLSWFQPVATEPLTVTAFGPQIYTLERYLSTEAQGESTLTNAISPQPIALYDFQEGAGTVVHDQSGMRPSLDLTIADEAHVRWLNPGLAIEKATLVASTQQADKIIAQCQASNALTIEAWLKPAGIEQRGPARILTLSADPINRNFTLGQGLFGQPEQAMYDVRLRTTATDNNGLPSLAAGSNLTTTLTHVAYTKDALGEATLYINGEAQGRRTIGGDFANWNLNFHLALGNEFTNQRPWLGEYYMVALYCQALTADIIQTHVQTGVSIPKSAQE